MPVYIVTLDITVAELRAQLGRGTRFIRELPPGRVVVEAADAERVTALRGVRAVSVDSLEHPDGPTSSR